MRTVLLLVGLLLCSAGGFAQGKKKKPEITPIDHDGKVAVPITPALPGEEKLSAQERVERDFLMPVRRKQSSSRAESTAVAPPVMTARHEEKPEKPGEAATPPVEATKPAETAPAHRSTASTSHRSSSAHTRRRSSRAKSTASRKKSSTRKSSANRKSSSAKKKTTRRRRR